uniref:Uncharacterized protein n=1 Tax=Myotis lucifugus TaxID=59463 RepID=G1PZR1_MYOLU
RRGERPPSHKDNPPLGAKGQEEPSAGSTQRPHPASAREKSTPPSEVASDNPEKKRKHKHPGEIQSHKYEQRLHGRHLGAPQGRGAVSRRGERPPSHKDNPPLGAKGQEEPSAGSTQRPHPASAREESTRPLCGEGPGGKLSSHGVKKRKERGGSSPQKSPPPSEVASDNPEKKRKHKHSGTSQSDKAKQSLHGSDAGKGAGVLPPKVRQKVGRNLKTPEGKGKTPHLGRKPIGPSLEEEEEFQPPAMSFQEALHTHHQPPARKERKIVKAPATAPEGMSLRKEETTSAQAEMGKSEKRQPPAAAGARLPLVPPARSPAWPDLGLCPGQVSDPPLPAFASTSSFQPRPRAPPSPSKEEAARLMGIRVHSRTPVFSGSKRACRRKMITMLQQGVQTPQNNINLLSQLRGVPCSLLQHAVESDTPEEPPGLEEHHEAPAAETDPLWKQQQCHRALEKARREEHTAQLQPQEQEVPELALHLSANRPQGLPAKRAFSESSERGAAGAAVQEKAPPAPAPAADTRAPSDPARRHSCHPIPGKRVVSGQKKPVKKMAPLMAKSIKDYKKWTYFLR